MNKQNLCGKRKYSQVNPSLTSPHYLIVGKKENFNTNLLILIPFKATTENKYLGAEFQTENSFKIHKEEDCLRKEKTNFNDEFRKENIDQFHTIEEIEHIENLNPFYENQIISFFEGIKEGPIIF